MILPNLLLIYYRFDPVAWFIRLFTKSEWNHVCWVIDKNSIIESKRYGIRVHSINKYSNKFLFKTKKLIIKDLKEWQKELIEQDLFIQGIFEPKRDYILRLLSFICVGLNLKMKFHVPTCSGFIALACIKYGILFCNKDPNYVTPEDINSSKIVEEIKNE